MAQSSSVYGIIIDKTVNSPLEFTSVSIYKTSDSSLVDGTLTDLNGRFLIKGLKPGSFYLKVQFLGYDTKTVSDFSLTGKKLNIGIITLNPDSMFLNEVLITGQQTQSFNMLDKQIYKADQFEAAKGGTAIDVLKNLPSVAVSRNGEIFVRGSTGFLVLINGQPVHGDAEAILSQLPANTLENLEFIAAPSAKYDTDGKGGILNITTKKGLYDGISLLANVHGGMPSTTDYGITENQQRYGGDFAFNYRKDMWNATASVNYLRNDHASFRVGDAIINTGIENRSLSQGEHIFYKYNYGGRFNVRFTPNKNNNFSVELFAGTKFQDRLADINYRNTKRNGAGRNDYLNSNLQTNQGDFIIGNFDYAHTFTNKSVLSFSTLYEYDDLYGSMKNTKVEGLDTAQNTVSTHKKTLDGFRARIDYSVNVGAVKLEMGYQYRMDKHNGNFDYMESDFGGPFNPAPLFIGNIIVRNHIQSVYSQFSGRKKRLEYVGGLRYENAKRELYVSNITNHFKMDYNDLFPSANIFYTIGKKYKIKAGMSRRIQRTNSFELNPIPERDQPETLEQGDPNLLPEFIYVAEVGLIKTFKKGSFFTTFYFQSIKNPIQRVNSVFADTILNRIFTNAGKSQKYGMELGRIVQATEAWNVYFSANLYQYDMEGSTLQNAVDVEGDGFAYSLNLNSNFNFSNTWSMQGNINYLSKRPTVQGEDSSFLSPSLSFKKTFLDGRLMALLQWQNIDLGKNLSNTQSIITAGDFYTKTNNTYETDVFILNLGFKLNKLTKKLNLSGS